MIRIWAGNKRRREGRDAVRGRRRRPSVMVLEGRELLSTLTVSNTKDSGLGSLRAAITQANTDGGGDTIVFSSLFNTPQTVTLIGGSRARAGGGLFNAVRAPPKAQPSRAVHEWVADVVRPRERAGPSTEFD
jgi:hypothetical protein